MLKINGQRNNWLIVAIFLITVSLWLQPMSVEGKKAKYKSPDEDPVTITILPKLPDDNLGGKYLGYFNLPKQKKQQRVEKINVFNPTDKTIKLAIKVVDADTSPNGSINYTKARQPEKGLLMQPGSQVVTVPKKFTIKPQESLDVPIKIKKPAAFSGIKAAAIQILASDQQASQASVQNEYLYTIGLLLNGRQLTKRDIKPLKLDHIQVQKSGAKATAIKFHYINQMPNYLKQMNLRTTLVNQKVAFFKYEKYQKEIKIAPSSKFNDTLALNGKRLVAGYYRLTVENKNDEYQKQQTYYVRIKDDKIEFIQKNTYQKEQQQFWLWFATSITALIIIISGWWLIKRKKAK